MSRLSRAASISPVIGVRFTQTVRPSASLVRALGPGLDDEGDLRPAARPRCRSSCERRRRAGIGVVGEGLRTDSSSRSGVTGLAFSPAASSSFSACVAGDVLAEHAAEPRLRDDLARLAAGAAVEVRDQLAHRRRAAGVEQLMELRGVVPPRRGLAGVGRSGLRQVAGHLRPVQSVAVRTAAPGRS